MRNSDIAAIFKEISEYLALQGELIFKVRAYERAAEAISGLGEELAEVYRKGGLKTLEEIPGVGVSLAEKIEELLTTGRLRYYERLKKKIPINLGELFSVEGLGPKHIQQLYRSLKIADVRQLEAAAREGKIRKLKGFGEKSEQNILRGIEFLKRAGGRLVLGYVRPQLLEIEERLRNLPGVRQAILAGSVRRWKETIGDVDILIVAADHAEAIMEYFTHMPEAVEVIARGPTKSVIKLRNGMEADLRVVPEKSYGAALNYFTGSKEHNVALRQRAIERGLKLNEYGLFRGRRPIAGETEENLYQALGLAFIPPELREMTGEIEAAEKKSLPRLIDYGDLKGDLQVQTDWTDGTHSIEAMARAAQEAGLEYIVITDHSQRLAMTGGLDEKKLVQQGKEIDKLNQGFMIHDSRFKILKGTECDILKDGRLDLPDGVLADLDVVGVSIHSHFNLSAAEQTKRIQRAMRNPHADILFHPTGRIINRRPACDVDMAALAETARETGTVMEINAYPDRLDLRDEHVRLCVARGVKLAINSDAHSPAHFSVLEYGIAQARRGWASKNDIINAQPLEKMFSMLKKDK